jgi:hypothetical protein
MSGLEGGQVVDGCEGWMGGRVGGWVGGWDYCPVLPCCRVCY